MELSTTGQPHAVRPRLDRVTHSIASSDGRVHFPRGPPEEAGQLRSGTARQRGECLEELRQSFGGQADGRPLRVLPPGIPPGAPLYGLQIALNVRSECGWGERTGPKERAS